MTNTETTVAVETTTVAPVVTKPAKTPKPKAEKPVGTAAKKAAKKPSKPVVTKPAAKAKPAAKKAAKAKPAAKRAGEAVSKSVIPLDVAKSYHRDNEKKTAGGNPSVDNGDKVAVLLRGRTLDEVYALTAKKTETPEKDLRAKYKHLNIGMQRMNLGNKLRAALA